MGVVFNAATGWHDFTASEPSGEGSAHVGAGTRKIYVDSAVANDTGAGTQAAPKKTLAAGVALLRNSTADWLLLKKGGVWLNQSIALGGLVGVSATEPILISAYGSGALPQIKIPVSGTGIGSLTSDYIAITDIDFYAHTKDPSSGTFISNATQVQDNINGASFINYVTLNSLLIEGCAFRFFTFGLVVQAVGANSGTLTFRRNLIADNYSRYGDSSGIYVENIASFINHENLYDHIGWNETVTVVGNPPQYRNHPYYAHATILTTDAVANIITRPSGSCAHRSGGQVTRNVCVRSPMAVGLGAPRLGTNTMTYNLALHGCDPPNGEQPLGQGLIAATVDAQGGFNSVGATELNNNVVAHEATTQVPNYNSFALYASATTTDAIIINNIAYDWANNDNDSILDLNGNNTITPNVIDGTGYLDPERTVETYMPSIGGTATLVAFVTEARQQTRDNWRSQYTADAVNNYVRAGFDLAPVEGGGGPEEGEVLASRYVDTDTLRSALVVRDPGGSGFFVRV